MLEVSTEIRDIVLAKDYGSVKQRKNEFIVGVIIGIIGCVYAIYVFVLQLKGLFS